MQQWNADLGETMSDVLERWKPSSKNPICTCVGGHICGLCALSAEIEHLRAANDLVCSMLLDAARYAREYEGKTKWADAAETAVASARIHQQQTPTTEKL
jgi:hypothetical protein